MRFHRALLRLYPASFRTEYGSQLAADFDRRSAHLSAPARAFAALSDVVPNAAALHAEIFTRDVRVAWRSFARAPGFAAAVMVVVALGVGANTAAFSLADFVFFRPLPFAQPHRLVKIWQRTPGYGQMELSPANYRDWMASARSIGGAAAYTSRAANLVGTSEPRRLETVAATTGFHQLLGVPAMLGRGFIPADETGPPVVVLSHGLWQSQFGGHADVLGSAVRLDGTPHIVVGVMPPTFNFPSSGTDAWVPLVLTEGDYEDRNDNYLKVVARLRPSATVEQARNEMVAIAARLESEFPAELKDVSAWVYSLENEVSSRARTLVFALLGAALCILLLASANVASLFLARAAGMSRELAVRTALGAGRDRLVRQLVTESLALSIAGGILGVALAWVALPALSLLVPASLPIASQPELDLRVLVFAMALMILTGLAFGVGPAFAAGRANAMDAIRSGGGARDGGGRTQRTRSTLVVVEVAASVVLLVLSGLLIRSVWNIQAVQPGFDARNVLTMRTALPRPQYDSVARREQYYMNVLRDVRALPGVQGAAFITGLPVALGGFIWPVTIAGSGDAAIRDASTSVGLRYVTTQYFTTLGIPLRRGRDVREDDTQQSLPVAVVSEAFAERHWPGEDPIGKRFTIAFAERTIVGVAGEVRVRGREQESEPQVYLPFRQVADGAIVGYFPKDLAARSSLAEGSLVPAIRGIIRRADADLPVSHVRSMEAIVSGETASRVTQLRLLAALAAIGLLIAGVGIHGLLSFTVSRRARELGVRRALGAQAGGVVRLVVGEGMRLTLAGVVVGVLVSWAAARAMGALLVGVEPRDPVSILGAVALCGMVALIGCLLPALRAARVDPLTALRSD